MAKFTIKRLGAGWYRATIGGDEFDIEYCSTAEGWGFTGWMWRSVERPQSIYSDTYGTKRDCVAGLRATFAHLLRAA